MEKIGLLGILVVTLIMNRRFLKIHVFFGLSRFSNTDLTNNYNYLENTNRKANCARMGNP